MVVTFWRRLTPLARRTVVGYVAAPVTVALISLFLALVETRVQVPSASMLYLVAVLATATAYGSGPALLASFVSVAAYDWFFVEPRHTPNVAGSLEWTALLLFSLTAIITGQLAAGQRQRAEDAARREREAVVLYDVVRLLTEPDLNQALQLVAQRLLDELNLAAVSIAVGHESGPDAAPATAGDVSALRLAQPLAQMATQVLDAGRVPTRTDRGEPGQWISVAPSRPRRASQPIADKRLHVVPVRAGERELGSLLLVRAPDAPEFSRTDDRLLSAVAAQLGLAVEHNRLRREANQVEILRGADEMKTVLLRAVSHDLRTPLSSIIAFAGSLRQTDVTWTDAEQRDFAEAIEQEARRLNRIVGHLLDLSRIGAGQVRLDEGWYDFSALVDDVLGRLRPMTAHHRVVVDVGEDLPPVPLDYMAIDQVLSNLIENAVKYAPRDTEIRVSARLDAGEVQLSVVDRGPGIASAALARVFEPFFRASGNGPRPQGTGLGLAVVKGLVEAHGGRAWAENRPDGGARFTFTLPLTRAPRLTATYSGTGAT
ncbi:MAG TPA: ATP-binding protein [Chloroflexota bacterium]|nr:ATP-binding protein [Chloroflexota bacterium]